MTCCKADVYGGWCKDLNTTPRGGDNYCYFHAPKENHRGNSEEFNNMVFKHIQKAIALREECNLSGAIFPGPIKFEQFAEDQPFPAIDFSNATFFGEVEFRKITFSGKTSFRQCTFCDKSTFFANNFQDEAHLDHSVFRGLSEFAHNTFNGNFSIGQSTFLAKTLLSYCKFNDFFRSHQCDFKDILWFECNDYRGDVNFNGSSFGTITKFVGIGHVRFFITDDSVNIFSSIFEKGVSFTQCKSQGEMYFEGVEFNDVVAFNASAFAGKVTFESTIFNSFAHFSNITFAEKALFKDINFTSGLASFRETDLTNVQFLRCIWPQKKSLVAIGSYDVLPDGLAVEKRFSQANFRDKILNYSEFSESYRMVGELYRQLKQQHKERHNESEASNWHYNEKEMFRKEKWWRRFNPIGFTTLYWAFSGYGERPVRAGVMLLLLMAGITLIMNKLGLSAVDGENMHGVMSIQGFSLIPDWTKFWLLFKNTAQYSLFINIPDFKPMTLAGEISLLLSTRIAIPLQAALFAFSLRNKFRR